MSVELQIISMIVLAIGMFTMGMSIGKWRTLKKQHEKKGIEHWSSVQSVNQEQFRLIKENRIQSSGVQEQFVERSSSQKNESKRVSRKRC